MLLKPTGPLDQTAAPGRRYRSADELEIRDAVQAWGKARWPEARCVHELVIDRGTVRADLAFIDTDHLVSVEIKSDYDTTDRLLNQVAHFRLATPETWIVVDRSHVRDAEIARYLLPSIGVATATRHAKYAGPFDIDVLHEPSPFVPHPEALLSVLWVAELHHEAIRARVWQGKGRLSHAGLVAKLQALAPAEQLAAVCRQLRARDALWRADPPIACPGLGDVHA